jgi:hypothetical protein
MEFSCWEVGSFGDERLKKRALLSQRMSDSIRAPAERRRDGRPVLKAAAHVTLR